jgi:hypothetical protein
MHNMRGKLNDSQTLPVRITTFYQKNCLFVLIKIKYMKTGFLILIVSLSISALGQEPAKPSFRKYPVASTPCSVYLPKSPGEWTKEAAQDSSDVYTVEVKADPFLYDVIAVKFAYPIGSATSEQMENLLISYLDYLKTVFKVKSAAGYGKGHILPGNDKAYGVLDFWDDTEGLKMKVKGWITREYLSVMVVSGKTDPGDAATTDIFLNGFRFPE